MFFPLQTISNVLLSYADIISKCFANYVSMEKVVSGQRLNEEEHEESAQPRTNYVLVSVVCNHKQDRISMVVVRMVSLDAAPPKKVDLTVNSFSEHCVMFVCA